MVKGTKKMSLKHRLLVLISYLIDEVMQQRKFLRLVPSRTDKRFMAFRLGLEHLVRLFDSLPPEATEREVRWVLDAIRTLVEDQNEEHPEQMSDWEWVLMVTEEFVFGVLPEGASADFLMQRQAVLEIESIIPMKAGQYYHVDGEDFFMGAPFAKGTDRWVHPVDVLKMDDHPTLQSRRLSELLPLDPKDFILTCLLDVYSMDGGIGREQLRRMSVN